MSSIKCVHCLNTIDEFTWDHVFPKAWYPDNMPNNIEKWKIPSCKKCNAQYGKIENNILVKLGLCIPPNEARALGIPQKALRNIKPEYAKSEKDRKARQKKREQIISEMKELDDNQRGVLPNFGNKYDYSLGEKVLVTINGDDLENLCKKIIRGLTYVRHKKLISSNYSLKVHFPDDKNVSSVIAVLEDHGIIEERGPGINIMWAETEIDPVMSISRIEIWGMFTFYGTVVISKST